MQMRWRRNYGLWAATMERLTQQLYGRKSDKGGMLGAIPTARQCTEILLAQWAPTEIYFWAQKKEETV